MTTKSNKTNPADKVEQWPIEKLVPYAKNSRTHSDEQVAQIAASIKEWGFTTAVLVDESGSIIAGHGRVMAARKLGLDQVPVMVAAGWTDAQKRAYVIADNKLALNAGWDEKMLALEFADLRALEYDTTLTGFSLDDIDELLAELDATPEGNTEADAAPPVPTIAKTQPGDLWLLGKHRLLCGDSTNLQAVQMLMGGGMADLLVTDPPYNVAYEGGTADKLTIKNDSMSDADFRQFLRNCYAAADSAMKPGAAFYIWHADMEGFNFRAACVDIGWKVRQLLLWKKNALVLGRQDYQVIHEPCLYGWKEGAAHSWYSDRKQTTVLEFNKPQRNGEHPTMKPVDLIQYQVENSSRAGDIVLDLFGGSGTTLIACEKTGRINRSMELDPKYCDVIVQRWQDFTGQTATLEADGRTFDEVKNGNEKAQN